MSSKYKVIKLLGETPFSSAFLCEKDGNMKCVIQQIRTSKMSKEEIKDIAKKVEIVRKLDHQNILKIIDFFVVSKPKVTLNITWEYADGGNLSEKIKMQNNKPFSESEILDYFTQICLALKYIHERKVIHRELKSDKIFLMKNGLIKLGGFDIYNILNNVKMHYQISPEILENKRYDSKADIWSLGVLLYEMATFKMPFDANSLPLLSIRLLRGIYTPISSIYSKELREIVSKCLSLNPSKRPTIQQILQMPIIQNRIKHFLDEVQYNKEFLKTIGDSDNKDNNKDNKKSLKDENSKNKAIKGENIDVKKDKTIKEVDNNNEEYSAEFKEIELLQIELEKALGLNLFKAAYDYINDNYDKKDIKFNEDKDDEKIKNYFKNKGFAEKEIDTAIKKIPDIFAIVKKRKKY